MSVFDEMNQVKTSWAERSKVIKTMYPSTAKLDWYEVFYQDPTILGKMVNDIIKLDQVRTGKPGKRPSLDEQGATERLRKLRDEDHTTRPLSEALKVLAGDRSIRSIATKIGLDKSYVHRLLKGDAEPSLEVIEKVAKAFNKHPSYFVEYRIGYIMAMLDYKLNQVPEMSVVFYNKLAGRNERGHS